MVWDLCRHLCICTGTHISGSGRLLLNYECFIIIAQLCPEFPAPVALLLLKRNAVRDMFLMALMKAAEIKESLTVTRK